MDPPARPVSKRRAAPTQSNSLVSSHKYPSDASPSPLASTPKSMHTNTTEVLRPRPHGQTVAIEWDEDNDTPSGRTSRLQIELAECVETKTVTTTTTTKRSYPPLLFRQKGLDMLDAKEYPLALKPTPDELKKISYNVDGQSMSFFGDDFRASPPKDLRVDTLTRSPDLPENKQIAPENKRDYQLQFSELNDGNFRRAEPPSKKLGSIRERRSARLGPEVWLNSPSSSTQRLRKPNNTNLQSQNGHSATPEESRTRHKGLGMHITEHASFPATPDMSELESSVIDRSRAFSTSFRSDTPQSGVSQNDSFEAISDIPDNHQHQESFANAVATPPIAESDLEPLEATSVDFADITEQRPPINTAAAQNASLPSPGLSPTFASAELDQIEFPGVDLPDVDGVFADSPATQLDDSQETLGDYEGFPDQYGGSSEHGQFRAPSLMDSQSMLETFDSMPNDMKTLMMYQLLRRCSRKTLHTLADVIGPALKCDFLDQLPAELSLQILGFLDHKDLCKAAQVSKHWRNVIDSNETGWKELFDRDGFAIPIGELEKAIHQGWGWQDPHGPDGWEQDLSVQPAGSSDGDASFTASVKVEEPVRKVRSTTKRKRVAGGSASDRAKRRATGSAEKAQSSRGSQTAVFSKSEGPMSAAGSAARAVPDPRLGLASLRKLHLFKSLYRRHYMLQRNWMSNDVAPHHFAFPAHPAHVITCLQFDDDKILTGSDDTLIHVYDTKTGALRKKLEGHEGGVWALQYEGNVLVSGSTDRSVRVWDIEKGLCTQVFHGHTSTVRCLQILMPEMTGKTPKGKPIMVPEKPLIITGSRDSQLRVWKLPEQGSKRYIQTGPPANDVDCPYFLRTLSGHTHSVRAIAAHRDTLVSGSYDNTVRVWKISTGETIHQLRGHSMKVYSVVLDHKRNRCISGSMDNFVKIWSLETGACLFTLEGHNSLVGLLDLRDERLVSAAADSTLRIWDPENGQCKSTLTAHTGAITCFQHDGQKVISGSDRTLKMWNMKTGECIKDLLTDLTGVWQVKFDERRCVAAVQRDNLTYVEVLDFGASRDGIPASERGSRKLVSFDDHRSSGIVEEDEDP
ncbi:Cell division control protein [Lachnellula subtilissima]|uniref:Cell division control protein n=1 Tax=Lachnellula subtilissima TaxID=602034 RepID=A0A8H8UB02_9HELO|nr:Cell division control protein [Lachnellula subtilissima]